jgi:putative transposase
MQVRKKQKHVCCLKSWLGTKLFAFPESIRLFTKTMISSPEIVGINFSRSAVESAVKKYSSSAIDTVVTSTVATSVSKRSSPSIFQNRFMMQLDQHLKRHHFPLSIISQTVWLYHRFNHSYRDIQEQLAFRGIILSHETVREWCLKFADLFKNIIKNEKENQATNGIWMK